MDDAARPRIEIAAARPAPERRATIPAGVVFPIIIAVLVAVPLAIVVALNINANSANTFALLNQRAVLLTDAIGTGIARHLDEAAAAVDFIAAQHESGTVDLTDRESALVTLRGASAALPQVEALIVFTADRLLAGVVRGQSGRQGELPAGPIENADIAREVARTAELGHSRWGDLVFREGSVFANYGAPLKRGGAVVAAAVSITTLSEIVTEISDKHRTTAFILNGTDRVLAHPNLVSGHPELSEATPTVPLTRIGDPVIAAFPEREVFDTFAAAGAEGVEVASVSIGERDYIIIYRVVTGYGPRPWIIGAHFAAEDVGIEVERLVRVASISLGALIAAMVVAFAIARLMSRPMRRLTRQAALITDLALDEVSPLPRSRIRELDQSAAAFNAMLDGLRAFAAYVPRTLVSRLIHSGIKATTQSSERDMTIMFTDIVGFTGLSEQLAVSDVAHLLNHHFRIQTRIIESHDGTVDKFIGDGMMAFWGAPEPLDDHAAAACRAALEIAGAIAADNTRRIAEGGLKVRVRIGIHTGRVIVGNIGGGGRINYTVIGDAVNIAQRLEDFGHEIVSDDDVTILISAETAAGAGPSFVTEAAGKAVLRGRRAHTVALRLIGTA